MEKKFILALYEHRVVGYMFHAYIAEIQGKVDFYTLIERITNDDVRKRPNEFTDDEKKVVKLIEECSDHEITRAFSKKKINNQEFISGLTTDIVKDHVRPYIEKRLLRIVNIVRSTSIEVYFKDSPKQVYCSEIVSVEKDATEAIFNFILNDTEFKYFLSISHQNKEMKLTNRAGIILVNDPCHLIISNKLLIFNDIDGKKLSPFFRTEFVNVPKSSEKVYLEKFVLNAIKNFRVNCTGFQIISESPTPTIILYLEGDLQYNPVLNLKFDYGNGRVFRANEPFEVAVTLQNENGKYAFHKTSRDAENEKNAVNIMQSLGLLNDGSSFFWLERETDENLDNLIGNMVNWLNTNQHELKLRQITVIQAFYTKQFYLNSIDIKTSFLKKADWFDVHTVVVLGEFTIPFVRLRKHILNGNREYMLPNGEIVVLPKEWFAMYSDLFHFGKTEGDSFIFKPIHYQSLREIFLNVSKEYSQTIADLYVTAKTNETPTLPDVNASLRPYQHEGFSWMHWLNQNRFGAVLADDMGLGKTLQTLVLIKKLTETITESNNLVPATLVVLPSSLVHNWYNEIQKFTPSLNVLKYIALGRITEITEFCNYNIILTTYGVVRNEFAKLKDYKFLYVILDESQTIKNPESKIFQAVTELKSQYRLVLTGTPIENSLTDLWSQIEFINPGLLGDLRFFKQYFANPIEKDNDEKKREKLKRLILPFILRRTKQEVAPDLPELTEQIRLCTMSDTQKSFYEEEKSKVRNEILGLIDQNGVEKLSIMVLNALLRLRQIANHPVLVNDSYLADSGKFEEVISSLEIMFVENHKVLIFSSFVKHLELFQQFFESKGWSYSMLTGETRNREEVVNDFQTNVENKFFLISLKAGGVGLNLTAAEYVFMLDPWWNPAAEMQAISRAHRIGQTNKVFVYRFISAESIEEKIIKLQERKAELAETFINNNNPFKSLSKESIMELFE